MEDMGDHEEEVDDGTPKDMLNPTMKKSLEKQGYTVVGQHSGVKLCRWTKNHLRGRGACYKHSFYGIISSRCMEMTPSLACANKCVFCWRHHTNPVGKEWKWKMDEPEKIVDGALSGHENMLKPWKGHDLVTAEKLLGAMNPQHCALSLVGEPIMYPRINKIIDLLHSKKISTFLVTNAQFPEQLKNLKPVTQLYLSIDAPTKEALKAVDRPLHSDFFERFLACVNVLKEKKVRTVFRLTLVKGWNTKDIADYARLIARGMPSLVEVKGVTYSGHDGELDLVNVPFHIEVKHFCEKLASFISDDYEVACEHEHSCCVLLARKQFKRDGVWHTWIDYPKFSELVESGEPFDAYDYMAKTPDWAVYNSVEKGFNPDQKRVIRHASNPRRDMALNKAKKEISESQRAFDDEMAKGDVGDYYRNAKKGDSKLSGEEGNTDSSKGVPLNKTV